MQKIIFGFVLGLSAVGLFTFVYATSPFDITFPIPELGNCQNKDSCKAYCDDLSHKDECVSFAKKHGFISDEDAEKAAKMPNAGPGGCKSENECRAYCADEANMDECLAFAKQHGIGDINKGEIARERAKLIRETGGPGQCQSERECRAYCDNPAHADECLAFAEKHNLIDKKELKAARKVMKEGGPGGCRSKDACEAYCENPDNIIECVKFAEEHDLIDPKEAEMIKKMPPVGPGGCRGKECKTYCDNPEHGEECLAFAEQNGLMPKEELERAKKLAGKPGPGGCRGPRECEMFCGNPDNGEICFQFAVDNDLMPREEIERIKKMKETMKEGGPGGCRGPQECRAYCEDPKNQEKCFEFAKERQMMLPEEMNRMNNMREMNNQVMKMGGPGGCRSESECRAYCGNPEHVEECLAFAVKMGGMNVDEAEDKLKTFVEEAHGGMISPMMRGPGMADRGAMMPPPGMMGEINPEKFREIEQQRFERFERFRETGDFAPPPSIMMREGMSGPGGCQSPEECMKYCYDPANRDKCARFNPSVGAPPPGEMFRQMEPGAIGEFQGFEENKSDDLKRCGPKPAMPTPQGCVGPVCREGRWDFECKGLDEGEYPTGGGMMPPAANIGDRTIGAVCAKEYNPVCGANGRTYPNRCFAERDKAEIKHEGVCRDLRSPVDINSLPPRDGIYPAQTPPSQEQIEQMKNMEMQRIREEMMQKQIMAPPSGVISPPPEFIPIPPPSSRNAVDYFFATILEGFGGLFRLRR